MAARCKNLLTTFKRASEEIAYLLGGCNPALDGRILKNRPFLEKHQVASPSLLTSHSLKVPRLRPQVIEGLKWLCYELTSAVQGGNAALLAEYTADAEQLVHVLTDKVQHTFTQEHISTRLCKYVLNTLMQVSRQVACFVAA